MLISLKQSNLHTFCTPKRLEKQAFRHSGIQALGYFNIQTFSAFSASKPSNPRRLNGSNIHKTKKFKQAHIRTFKHPKIEAL